MNPVGTFAFMSHQISLLLLCALMILAAGSPIPQRPLRRPSTRTLALNLLVSLMSVLITLGSLELVARQVYPPPSVGRRGYREAHPTRGWQLTPNAQSVQQGPEYRAVVSISSHGLRDVEHTYEKPAGVFRIVVLGDSFMEAAAVDLEKTFARRLEQLALEGEGTPRIEVINMGVGGYGTIQEYLFFVEEGVRYDPDLVLLGFTTANDVQNNSRELSQATFPNSEDRLSAIGRPYIEVNEEGEWSLVLPDMDRNSAIFEEAQRREMARPWWQKSALYWVGEQGWEHIFPPGGPEASEPEASLRRSRTGITWLGPHLCKERSNFTEAWEITEVTLVRLNEAVKWTGAELVVFSIPGPLQVDDHYLEKTIDLLAYPDSYCFEDNLPFERLNDILSRHQIRYIDLLPVFQQATQQDGETLVYRITDNHWNADGHSLAAQTVYDYLRSQSLIPD